MTLLLVLLLTGLDEIASMEHAVDGRGGSFDAVSLQEELDLILADPGLGPLALVSSELLDELFLVKDGSSPNCVGS